MTKQLKSKETIRGASKREAILEAALDMFRHQGFEATTMRAIAAEAGVSLGNAYYYFESKEHLVMAFYESLCTQQLAKVPDICKSNKSFLYRLRALIRHNLSTVETSKEFFAGLFRCAADPKSPLNPFSTESAAVRARSAGGFAAIIAGSDLKVNAELAKEMPVLLWLYYMGIVLFWMHDRSFGSRKTNRLIDLSTELICKVSVLFLLPMMGGVIRLLVELVQEFTEDHDI